MLEVLKQALEALETAWYHVGTFAPTDEAIDLIDKTRGDLRQAIADLEKQKPVAFKGWYCDHCQRGVDASEVTFHEQHTVCGRVITDDLPPSSQPRKPLTDEMILQAKRAYSHDVTRKLAFIDGWFSCESTHGIKE
jgi:hypothetical protein